MQLCHINLNGPVFLATQCSYHDKCLPATSWLLVFVAFYITGSVIKVIFYKFIILFFSGTEQQHVANDYAKRLAIGVAECEVQCYNVYIE